MNDAYQAQVRLMLDLLPLVAEEAAFALKGGTAINFFVRNMPRLSVDIDLTYLPLDDRAASLAGISEGLARIKARAHDRLPGTRVTLVPQSEHMAVKVHCQRGRARVKIEVNPLQRGSLWPVRQLACTDAVQEAFESFVELPVVSHADLFGGKLSAALDRQHPRDLFDVRHLLDAEGFGGDVRAGLLVNVIGHRRPIVELLAPEAKDQRKTFEGEFSGMTLLPFDYAGHEATFVELIGLVHASLTDADRRFLLGFEAGDPDWSLFTVAGADRLPAPRWKLLNIQKLRSENRAKHAAGLRTLAQVLGMPAG
ncbi:MAG: nucleotidyl transferase AbiEii/AbiGii toxin family protein [Planctomycetes bacterium]|nr:nucleotidyl transferase AbiEii/AbiGii toxin family protein [Planctomycetota bacterium]